MYKDKKKLDFLTNDEKLQKRAEILYGSTKENKKLGKSIYDNDDDEVKGELSALVEPDSKNKLNKNKKEKDYEKIADLFYPTMKNKTDKIDSIKSDKKTNDEKLIILQEVLLQLKII